VLLRARDQELEVDIRERPVLQNHKPVKQLTPM
jgi:hypothetical protein